MLQQIRNRSSLLTILIVVFMVSCNKTHYGTTISIQNYLAEDFEIEVFPSELPYSSSTSFLIPSGQERSIYSTTGLEIFPTDLLLSTFDSIKITLQESGVSIKFDRDTSINYMFNPYLHSVIWHKRILEHVEYDMSRYYIEDQDHYFKIEKGLMNYK